MALLKLMPGDILHEILSFISAREIDTNVSSVCCWLRELTSSPQLWKKLCILTGKIRLTNDATAEKRALDDKAFNAYRDFYYSNPCVPTDYKTISKAVKNCNAGSEVVLLPGIYNERVILGHVEGQSKGEVIETGRIHITIRAAFAEKGAALTFLSSTAINKACLHIRGENVTANITNVQILHSSRGNDIWGGNCAVFCEGGALVAMHGCKITSESGRGVVLLTGSRMNMTNCTISDCAATGCYVSDPGTTFNLSTSNIIRNGIGTRRSTCVVDSSSHQTEVFDFVPPGHSGLYIESAESVIENCLISGNLLTGVSVVRNGLIRITKCDLTQNGEGWLDIEVEEGNEVFLGNIEEGHDFQNWFQGVENNNHSSLPPANNVLLGGFIRPCTYPAALTETLTSLRVRYA